MAGEKFEVTTPLLENILNQPEALAAVADFQFVEGRAALEQAARLITSKRRVVLSGMGASHFACVPFQHAVHKLGIQATWIETAELLHFPAPTDDAVVVLVSRSGESIETVKLLDRISAPIIGITNVSDSTLARRAAQTVVLHSPADQLVAIQTYTATLAAFALIGAAMTNELDDAQRELDDAIEALDEILPEWVNGRGEWKTFLTEALPLYLLGRGATMGAVYEGQLLMHETAKTATIGMSMAQFRHGPVEVVDERFRGVLIGTQAPTLEWDLGLARNLLAMQAQVRWLGPKVGGNNVLRLCEWPESLPARFETLGETIPLQIAAYAAAEGRGLHPGEFRWAGAITNSESGFAGL